MHRADGAAGEKHREENVDLMTVRDLLGQASASLQLFGGVRGIGLPTLELDGGDGDSRGLGLVDNDAIAALGGCAGVSAISKAVAIQDQPLRSGQAREFNRKPRLRRDGAEVQSQMLRCRVSVKIAPLSRRSLCRGGGPDLSILALPQLSPRANEITKPKLRNIVVLLLIKFAGFPRNIVNTLNDQKA
ncbi:MAG: hypothetical protein M1336_05195 [Deltaproteobacteria bacterium]|nr:hypothetical protein [Deltaproteobacteria bacterium]